VVQAIRGPGIGIRRAAFGAIHKPQQVDAKATPIATLSGTLKASIPPAHNYCFVVLVTAAAWVRVLSPSSGGAALHLGVEQLRYRLSHPVSEGLAGNRDDGWCQPLACKQGVLNRLYLLHRQITGLA
jgi:hypothetical protein